MLVLFLVLKVFNCFLHLNNACIKIKQEDKMYHAYYVQNSILSALAREKENSKQKEMEVNLQQMETKLKELEERVETLTTQVKHNHFHDTFSSK